MAKKDKPAREKKKPKKAKPPATAPAKQPTATEGDFD